MHSLTCYVPKLACEHSFLFDCEAPQKVLDRLEAPLNVTEIEPKTQSVRALQAKAVALILH